MSAGNEARDLYRIFNNSRYTTNIPTDPRTVTTADIKVNMRDIHTKTLSLNTLLQETMTYVNNKILRKSAALKRTYPGTRAVP